MDSNNFRQRVWRKVIAKAGFRHILLKDLRHSFASLLIQQGESLAYVKEQMGHHSIQVTVDIYGHLVPGGNKAAVDRLDGPAPQGSDLNGPGRTLYGPTAPIRQPLKKRKEENPLQKQGVRGSHPSESNRRPTDYESVALPTELGWQKVLKG